MPEQPPLQQDAQQVPCFSRGVITEIGKKEIEMQGVIKFVLAGGLLGASSVIQALPVTAHIAADRHYGLYSGAADGSGLTLVGSTEISNQEKKGNGLITRIWNFDIEPGDYLYAAAWNHGGPQQLWMGNFQHEQGTLATKAADWLSYVPTGNDPTFNIGQLPGLEQLIANIADATWGQTAEYDAIHPWQGTDDLAESARYIGDGTGQGGNNHYVLFRTTAPLIALQPTVPSSSTTIPEPPVWLLLMAGFVGMGMLRRRAGK